MLVRLQSLSSYSLIVRPRALKMRVNFSETVARERHITFFLIKHTYSSPYELLSIFFTCNFCE